MNLIFKLSIAVVSLLLSFIQVAASQGGMYPEAIRIYNTGCYAFDRATGEYSEYVDNDSMDQELECVVEYVIPYNDTISIYYYYVKKRQMEYGRRWFVYEPVWIDGSGEPLPVSTDVRKKTSLLIKKEDPDGWYMITLYSNTLKESVGTVIIEKFTASPKRNVFYSGNDLEEVSDKLIKEQRLLE